MQGIPCIAYYFWARVLPKSLPICWICIFTLKPPHKWLGCILIMSGILVRRTRRAQSLTARKAEAMRKSKPTPNW
jgi:hypothetical protein